MLLDSYSCWTAKSKWKPATVTSRPPARSHKPNYQRASIGAYQNMPSISWGSPLLPNISLTHSRSLCRQYSDAWTMLCSPNSFSERGENHTKNLPHQKKIENEKAPDHTKRGNSNIVAQGPIILVSTVAKQNHLIGFASSTQCSQRGSPSVLRVGPGRIANRSPSIPGEKFSRG